MPPTSQRRPSGTSARAPKHIMPTNSHTSAGSGNGNVDPQSWLNFSLPPRRVPGSNQPGAPTGLPRRSRRGEGWRGGAMSRERYVHANFRFVLKPNETLSYGAHFADPDISLHWPHILQILVPTFSAFSVAQGYVSSDPARIHSRHPIEEIDDVASSIDETELMGMGEDAARVRQRMEEEKRGRMCPICLGKPVAGRMTKCGHIFCFPCVLHYIRLSEVPGSARCPICGDTIHEGMLKSVKYLDPNDMIRSAKGESEDEPDTSSDPSTSTGLPAYTGNADGGSIIGDLEGFGPDGAPTSDPVGESSTTGHKIYMRLLQRPQMTTLALPSSPTWPSDAVPPHTAPFNFLPDVQSYSRYVLATPEYMLSELQRELGELRREHELLKGDDLGREFVRAARDKVERQVEKVRNELMIPMVEREAERVREAWAEVVGGERKERQRKREREKREAERAALAAAQQEQALASRLAGDAPAFIPGGTPADGAPAYLPGQDGYIIPPNRPVEPNPMPSPTANKRNRRKPQIIAGPSTPPAGPSYHFYQSTLGANVFLHPLDIRILLSHYQSYSLFPSLISFTSPGFDPDTITDDLRKRAKYLSHLPLGTEVVFVEADLEPLVGAASLIPFEQALKARKQKRRSRVMKEDKAKVKAEKAERERHNHVSAEERDYLSAVARSAIGNTMHGGEGIASVHSLPLSAGMDSAGYLGSSVGSSTGAGGLGTSPTSSWGPNRSFAGALHSSARPTVYRPASARTAREPREGTGDDDYDPELDAQMAWDAAFEHLELQDARGGIRETSRGGVGGAGGGRGKGHRGEEDAAVLGSAQTGGDGAGAGAGGKKGKKGARKVLVLGGGGGRRA